MLLIPFFVVVPLDIYMSSNIKLEKGLCYFHTMVWNSIFTPWMWLLLIGIHNKGGPIGPTNKKPAKSLTLSKNWVEPITKHCKNKWLGWETYDFSSLAFFLIKLLLLNCTRKLQNKYSNNKQKSTYHHCLKAWIFLARVIFFEPKLIQYSHLPPFFEPKNTYYH